MNVVLLRTCALIVAIFISNGLIAQKLKVESGDFAVLTGQKILHVEYDYSHFRVGEFATEQEYVEQKVLEYNEKKPGKGERWKEVWLNDREDLFEPAFEEHFNRILADKGLVLQAGQKDARYTLVVKTTFVEPGFNAAIAAKDASVDFEFDLVETADRSARVAHIILRKVPGNADHRFDRGARLAESYALAAKLLSRHIKKKI